MNNSSQSRKKLDIFVRYLIQKKISVSTMESCTSGLLASGITDTEGASAIFKGAFVTYSNEAKEAQGVSGKLIREYGVYSLPVAEAMAEACMRAYNADIGIGVTGTTGNPDPENADSVPGEVYYAILWGEKKCLKQLSLKTAGLTRHEIKECIVEEISDSLCCLLDALSDREK